MDKIIKTVQDLSFNQKYLLNMLYLTITSFISKQVCEFLHIPFSILFYLANFGAYHTELYFMLLLFNLSILLLFNKSKKRTYFLMVVNLLSFGFVKQFSHLLNLDITTKNNVSIQFMLLVPKMYYTANEVIDVRYIFFIPSILAGPVIPLIDFIDRKECMFKFKKLLYVAFFGGILFLKKYISYEMLVSKENNFLKSFFLLYFYGFLFRSQFYFVWSFSSFLYALCGLEADNIHPFYFEMSENMQDVMRRWNVYVSIWLKDSIFLPSKKYGNTFAAFMTCFVSSMWHGFYLAYFMMFLSFPFCVTPLKNLSKFYQKFMSDKFLKYFNILITSLLVSFFSVPFYFLKVDKTLAVWSQVYYYGIIYVMIGYLYLIFTNLFNEKEKKE